MLSSIELFTGTGGMAIGLQNAGFSHCALFEWDDHSCENLRRNIVCSDSNEMKNWRIFQTDVRHVDFRKFDGKIDVVAGGPPCQPFSLGGKGLSYNDKRDMFSEAVRAVREIKPKAFIFENVRGLLRKSFSTYFNYILLQLTYPEVTKSEDMSWEKHLAILEEQHTQSYHHCLNYNVTFRLVNAADYGIPQQRHRVFIVGFRSDINANWSFPLPTHNQDELLYSKWIDHSYWDEFGLAHPRTCPLSQKTLSRITASHNELFGAKKRWQTVRNALAGLPSPLSEEAKFFNNHIYRGGAKIYPGHSGSLLDEPSKTIKAGSHGVPGGENMLCDSNGQLRYYTVRESARIQTFPDTYLFSSSWTESMRQIGNAVPVKLAEIVGKSVVNQLSSL